MYIFRQEEVQNDSGNPGEEEIKKKIKKFTKIIDPIKSKDYYYIITQKKVQ